MGTTQVAGLEPDSPPHFLELEITSEATPCDPTCAVYLPGETEPINVWRDEQWQRNGSGSFR